MFMINRDYIPNWLLRLEVEDLNFIRKFILSSGSLKEIAKDYGVSYPTMRLRLDKLIEKIKVDEEEKDDDFIRKIKTLVLDDKLEFDMAKEIIQAYRKKER